MKTLERKKERKLRLIDLLIRGLAVKHPSSRFGKLWEEEEEEKEKKQRKEMNEKEYERKKKMKKKT